ncbi:MAG TPA: PQQ-dependent sugar dehydrogenase [Opitutaceae bacterium]|nr:PQQ-dependent sugar dehydrogenase [Opitutaceae bacterium]
MLKNNFRLLLALPALSFANAIRGEDIRTISKGRDVGALYQQLCASCHGEKLTGSKARSLTDNVWRFGGEDAAIAKNIREGIPGAGMPGFAAALSEAEAQAFVVFIREMATRKTEPEPKQADPMPFPGEIQRSELHNFRFELVAAGLEVPWSIAFLPDGRMLVTERSGRLRVIENGKLLAEPVSGIPAVIEKGEGGLMCVVPHPDFAQNQWLYLSFSDPGENETAMTKIVRGKFRDGKFAEPEAIYAAPRETYQKGHVNFGSRMLFDGDHLFFTIGERGAVGEAQDLKLPNGKVHRVFHDGKIPPDNPFVNSAGAIASIWSYGNRNPQGLARDPRNGDLWETEHGPRGGDELNLIQRGRNYGWPVVTFGMNYDGTAITEHTEKPGMEQPVVHWTPSIAVSPVTVCTADKFPRWKNQLLVGSLAQQKLLRIVTENGKATHQEEIFRNLGRIRDIQVGPDGLIYLAFEPPGQPGRIARLVPAE